MNFRVTLIWFPVTCVFVAGCASVHEKQTAADPTDIIESIDTTETSPDSVANMTEAATSEPQPCHLPKADVDKLRVSAKEYLLAEWPVLDSRCERMSRTVVYSDKYGCMILGGPVKNESCEQPSHFGYAISFEVETLEPTRIGWLTERSIE